MTLFGAAVDDVYRGAVQDWGNLLDLVAAELARLREPASSSGGAATFPSSDVAGSDTEGHRELDLGQSLFHSDGLDGAAQTAGLPRGHCRMP